MVKTLGEGHAYVYVYTYSIYQQHRNLYDTYPCKIGMTHRYPTTRVQEQTRTSSPEEPELLLVIREDKAYHLEKVIHHLLHLYDRHIPDSPGKEWFMTSVEEIESIYNLLLQKGCYNG